MKTNVLKNNGIAGSAWLLGTVMLLSLSACELINPPEQIPAYIHVKNWVVEQNPGVPHGSVSSKITHANVFSDVEYMGIYTLPATIPILQEGAKTIIIDPMILENGQSFLVGFYPAYERFTMDVDLQPTEIDTIQPLTRYDDQATFHFVEDFESGNPIFSDDRDNDAETFMEPSNEEVFEGSRSGVIRLNKDHPFVEVATRPDFEFDLRDANSVYLELNYRTEVDVLFGLIGVDNVGLTFPSYEFGVPPKGEWTKVYFNLSEQVRLSGFQSYQIGITAGLPLENGAFSLDEAVIYLDNIKLISN